MPENFDKSKCARCQNFPRTVGHYCSDCNNAKARVYRQEHLESVRAQHNARKVREAKKKYAFVNEIKAKTPCADCGGFFPAVAMDFDHVRGEKKCDVSILVAGLYSLQNVIDEIKKCQLVCASCHRVRTFDRKNPSLALAPEGEIPYNI